VVTPATTGTILKGITRATAIEVIESKGIKVNQRDISILEVLERYHSGELVEIFGTGTAALVANVEEIRYDDLTLKFAADKWQLSSAIRDEINAVRFGTLPDVHGWTVPVKDLVSITV
jgi:branched-chain amino acid aminotransferase